jgi:hypothetical protein
MIIVVQKKSKPPHSQHGKAKAALADRWDHVFSLWAQCLSFRQIVESLKLDGETAASLRSKIASDPDLIARMKPYGQFRAHALSEQAIEWGFEAAAIGDASGLKVAIDMAMKTAARVLLEVYGDTKKVELTGRAGGAVQVKADLTLSPSDAYARMVSG